MSFICYSIIVTVSAITISCGNSIKTNNSLPHKKKTAIVKIDNANSFKISGVWVTLKPVFEYNTVNKSLGDTLDVVICGDYVYSPFGNINNKSAFKFSLLKTFHVTNKMEKTDIGTFEFNSLKYKSSKLLFLFDTDPEASTHSFIFKGEINDEDIRFASGLKIGMSVSAFYKTLFDFFPVELETKFKVFMFESCVDDITHIYLFKNGKLKSVKFKNTSRWQAEY